MSDVGVNECISSCPNGYAPNGNQCSRKLSKSSKTRIGLLVAFGILCVCMLVLWIVMKVCFVSKDNQKMIKAAKMRAIQ